MSTKTVTAVLVYILDAKIQKQRLKDMRNAASKRNISVTDKFCTGVTHIVTEFKEYEQVIRKLNITDVSCLDDKEVVSVQWFADCMRAGTVVSVEQKHRLQKTNDPTQNNEQNALEVLEKFADLRERDHDYSRALAFRRASCVLKSLPFALSSIQQLNNITNMGDHSKRVVQEILEDGESLEVENILKDSWFHKMKMFTGIFGIGPTTAKQFIAKGWSSIEEVQRGHKSADWRVLWGLAFHEDLTTPVLRHEARYIYELVQKHLKKVLPGAIAKVTGGFRRGKTSGHDVDILITHPKEDKIIGALPKLLHSLEATDTVLCGRLERSTYTDDVLARNTKLSTRGQLDHFEKWIGVIKVPKKVRSSCAENDTKSGDQTSDHSNAFNGTNRQGSDDIDTAKATAEAATNVTEVIYSRNGVSDNTVGNVIELEEDDTLKEVRNEIVESVEGSVDVSELKSGHTKASGSGDKPPVELAAEARDWLARRVDLIIAPYSQYYYALVGWTGSKQFNRDARTYSERKLSMKLTSHGLYDFNLGKKIPASSEKEVFDNLKLPYHDPWERNC